jgi:hypothetical protein
MKRRLLPRSVLAVVALGLSVLPAGRTAPGPATISYRRVFKGSVPEFIEIKVGEHGGATFELRQLDEDSDPQPFEVSPVVREKIFELAAALKNFAIGDLDVQKRIANLGQKTFRYERDSETHETSFNYTLDATANQLAQIFEGLARQQGDLVTLQRRVKYDRLGVNDALRQFESDLEHRLLPEPERVVPVLDQIAGDSRFMEIVRTRARALAERIRTSRSQ